MRIISEILRYLHDLLNHFYPQRTITVTSREPGFITPVLKTMLRRKIRLMRAGRIENADALAHRIRRIIERRNSVLFRHTAKADATDMWRKVRRQLTGRQSRSTEAPTGITDEELNHHYANVSTDTSYQPPPTKSTCSSSSESDLFTEFRPLAKS